MNARSIIAIAIEIGALVLSHVAWQRRLIDKQLRDIVENPARFIDASVNLHVVVADAAGAELLEGKPKLRVLRTHRLGGTIDTQANPARIIGPGRAPLDWYCSVDQERIILHGDEEPLGLLVYGSEGAGKTMALAMWHYVRWLEAIGESREGGQTAPTTDRLSLVRAEMLRLYRPEWFRHSASEDIFYFVDGTRIRMVSTYQQSKLQGSPIQGFSWSWCGRDEAQDQVERHSDIESRGRAAKHGRYKQLATATAKDESGWRTLRDALVAAGWLRLTMLGERSPFVDPSFWQAKKKTMSAREYARRVEAQDVGPERMLYISWNRKLIRPIPPNARRITSAVLSAKTGNPADSLLVGTDPGVYKAASILLDAYKVHGDPNILWWVRGELFTMNETTEQHGVRLLKFVQDKWGYNTRPGPERMHVRADPYGRSESHPDRDVYLVFARLGIDIKSAQYAKNGTGSGQIGREARIEMVNRLLCDAEGTSRLFVEADEHGRPVAPKLVESFESLERDESGRAERGRKDDNDMTDCPAALGYGLWPWEKEAATGLRAGLRDVA